MRIMLDTNIYDWIIETPEMVKRLKQLSEENKLVILCTHIQEDELANIPNEKRTAITEIKEILKKVPTNGAVYDVSRYGEATYDDGGTCGIGISDIRSSKKREKHVHDALIATTAARYADVLVTEDKRLAKRMGEASTPCRVWSFAEFKEYVFQQLK